MDLTAQVVNQYKNNSYGNALMNVTKKLASALVMRTHSYNNITLQTLGMESTKRTTPITLH